MNPIIFSVRSGTWDWHTVTHVFTDNGYKLPDCMRGDTFVDVGGHVGSATLRAAYAGAKVIVYEPAHDNFAVLEENVRINNFDRRFDVTCVNKAVGPKGKVTLIIDTCNTGQNTIFEERNDFGGVDKEEVEMVPLSEILENVKSCYLKMDCEGGEIEIIKEIVGGLWKKIHTIVMETHFHEKTDETLKELEQFYEVRSLDSQYEYKLIRR